MSDWRESTEGDLDPDLTNDAGYAGWEPPRRAWLPLTITVISIIVLGAFVAGIFLVFA